MAKRIWITRLIHLWAVLLLGLAPFLCIAYCNAKHTAAINDAISHQHSAAPTQAASTQPHAPEPDHFPLHDLTRMIMFLIEALPWPLLMLAVLCVSALIQLAASPHKIFTLNVLSPPPRLAGVFFC